MKNQQLIDYMKEHGANKTPLELSIETGVVISTIRKYSIEFNIPIRHGYHKVQERVQFIKDHGEEMTINQLARHFNMSYSSIHNLVESHNLTVKPEIYRRKGGREKVVRVKETSKAGFFDHKIHQAYVYC